MGASGRTWLFPQGGASLGGLQAGKGRPDLGAHGRPLEDGLWGAGQESRTIGVGWSLNALLVRTNQTVDSGGSPRHLLTIRM